MADEKNSLSQGEIRKAQEAAGSSNSAGPAPALDTEPAPAYEAEPSNSKDASVPLSAAPSASISEPVSSGHVPTLESPFNFPSDAGLPPYSPPSGGDVDRRPVAIPQVRADAAAGFISAYAPALLARGITPGTWKPFLETTSAFLTATVSDRAVSHAGDMAKHIGKAPASLGKSIVSHTKSVGKDISSQAKRGNVIGAGVSALFGAISIPVAAAMNTVGTTLSLPGHAIGAISKKPKTPYERAAAYAAVANAKWLSARGLVACLLDTSDLARVAGTDVSTFLGLAHSSNDRSASGQMSALSGHIANLDITGAPDLQLGHNTLWLVLVREAHSA